MRSGRKEPFVDRGLERRLHRDGPARGDRAEAIQGALSDPARRLIDDPKEAHVVGGVRNDPKVGEDVFDLGALVEAKPTHDPIRKRRSRQRLLDGAALSMHAIKDRNLAERGARRLKLVDGTNEERCLIPLIERLSDDDLRAVLALGEKTLRLAIDSFLDDRVGRAKNTRTRTIISLEFDARGLLK